VREARRQRAVRMDGLAGMTEKEDWISAANAVALLKPILSAYEAQMTICQRAHNGLIRARAERFMRDDKADDNLEVPRRFWHAEGHQALQQNWTTGDFSTWIEHGNVHLRAFGVTFARADIERLLSGAAEQSKPAPAKPSGKIGANVFIGHGRSLVWRELKDFLEDRLGLSVDEFNSRVRRRQWQRHR
jgi:hypothetical protein